MRCSVLEIFEVFFELSSLLRHAAKRYTHKYINKSKLCKVVLSF